MEVREVLEVVGKRADHVGTCRSLPCPAAGTGLGVGGRGWLGRNMSRAVM